MALNKNSVRILEITDDQQGQRIDNFLLKHLKNVPRSHIYRLLRSGQVRVNSGRKKPTYKLAAGDKLRIPPVRLEAQGVSRIPDTVIEALLQSIIYQDDDLLAINKPSGIAVHGGSGLHFGVIEAFRQIYPDTPLELVHRLDRETSGCLVLTKNRKALTDVHKLFQQDSNDKTQKQLEKTYLALVCGQWQHGSRTVTAALSKIKQGGEHCMVVDPQGTHATSHFEPVEIFKHYSLMRITIETGRMHQIRVHAQYCGHPIACDNRYGDKEQNRVLKTMGLKRLFLHAHKLYLPLQQERTLVAELPEELQQFLETLPQGGIPDRQLKK